MHLRESPQVRQAIFPAYCPAASMQWLRSRMARSPDDYREERWVDVGDLAEGTRVGPVVGDLSHDL